MPYFIALSGPLKPKYEGLLDHGFSDLNSLFTFAGLSVDIGIARNLYERVYSQP